MAISTVLHSTNRQLSNIHELWEHSVNYVRHSLSHLRNCAYSSRRALMCFVWCPEYKAIVIVPKQLAGCSFLVGTSCSLWVLSLPNADKFPNTPQYPKQTYTHARARTHTHTHTLHIPSFYNRKCANVFLYLWMIRRHRLAINGICQTVWVTTWSVEANIIAPWCYASR
jgi:hypothetical protein